LSAVEPEIEGGLPFRAAWWLPGGDLQTVWGRFARGRRRVPFRRERLETPDGDELVLDHVDLDHADGQNGAPRLLVLHGLEGSSYSVYVQGILEAAARRGLRGTALNFRSCARDPSDLDRMLPNRRPRLYHSGETEDLDFVVRTLAARDPETPLLAAGISLGGNVLLKWLGEKSGPTAVAAAAALSTPYDLAASARHLENPRGRFYVGNFLSTLRRKAIDTAGRFPEAAARIDLPATLRARTFYEFDDAATAPLHDFAGAEDYYRRSSSLSFLSRIATPTLCVSAEDDPFLVKKSLAEARDAASSAVEFRVTARGGHIGFVGGTRPWRPEYWAEELAVAWLARYAGTRTKKEPGSGVSAPPARESRKPAAARGSEAQ
jgi:predicted alpha/beta-fold hydrolase